MESGGPNLSVAGEARRGLPFPGGTLQVLASYGRTSIRVFIGRLGGFSWNDIERE